MKVACFFFFLLISLHHTFAKYLINTYCVLATVTDHDGVLHLDLIIFNIRKKKKIIDSNYSNSIYFGPNMVKLSDCGGSLSSQIENA